MTTVTVLATSVKDRPLPEDVRLQSPRVSVIVPCYNEESAIAQTIRCIREALAGDSYELILVNDCSTDGTADILDRDAARDPGVRVIHRARNGGYGASLKSGLHAAKANIIAITDADGTYPIQRLPELLEELDGADMVVGARTGDDVEYSWLRRIPKTFLRAYCCWLSGQRIPDMNSGLRVMRRAVLERYLSILPNGFSFTTTITLAMLTNDHEVRFVPIDYARRVGRSKIRPIRDTLNFIQLIVRTGMYFAPMRVFFPVAVLMGLAFLVSLAIDLYRVDITQSTLLLLLFSLNTGMFALLADMIDKRAGAPERR